MFSWGEFPQPLDPANSSYTFEDFVSKGRCSVLFKVRSQTGEIRACKVYKKYQMPDQSAVEKLRRRLRTLKKLDHPNIAPIIDVFDTKNSIFVITEYCQNGSAADRLALSPFSSREVFRISKQIISAVKYLHSQGIPHTNISLENIVFDSLMVPKFINFGLSQNVVEPMSSPFDVLNFLSPEELKGEVKDQCAVDIWKLGVCIFTLSVGVFPFSDTTPSKIISKIMLTQPKLSSFSHQIRQWIEQMLLKDPERRIKADGLIGVADGHTYLPICVNKDTKTVLSIPQQLKMEAMIEVKTLQPRIRSNTELTEDRPKVNHLPRPSSIVIAPKIVTTTSKPSTQSTKPNSPITTVKTPPRRIRKNSSASDILL